MAVLEIFTGIFFVLYALASFVGQPTKQSIKKNRD